MPRRIQIKLKVFEGISKHCRIVIIHQFKSFIESLGVPENDFHFCLSFKTSDKFIEEGTFIDCSNLHSKLCKMTVILFNCTSLSSICPIVTQLSHIINWNKMLQEHIFDSFPSDKSGVCIAEVETKPGCSILCEDRIEVIVYRRGLGSGECKVTVDRCSPVVDDLHISFAVIFFGLLWLEVHREHNWCCSCFRLNRCRLFLLSLM